MKNSTLNFLRWSAITAIFIGASLICFAIEIKQSNIDLSRVVVICGFLLLACGILILIGSVLSPWLRHLSRNGRLLLVFTFAPSVLIFLIYLLNGGNWPDDEVVTGSFIVGPLVVWGVIGLYYFIQSGEKEGEN